MANVKIYTKPGCPYCAAAKEDMIKRGAAFDERDVTSSNAIADEALAYSKGQRIVPIIVSGTEVKLGFNGG